MQLLSDNDESNLCVICVVAERGIGKTTLVRLIYYDQRVSNAFDTRLWVRMSGKFDEKMLMTGIIEAATQVPCDVMEPTFLSELVKHQLNDKIFLLVLEDADIENHSFCSNVSEQLVDVGAKGSAIIITTTHEIAASFPRAMHFHYLCPLPEEHSSQIFQQFACSDGHLGTYPGLKDYIKTILYKCEGNPLYVKAICGLICHSKSALQQLVNLKEASLLDLGLCCDLLPQHLNLCLALCSLFPKEYVYARHHLVRLWMSIGFINHGKYEEPEDAVSRYFNELFCRAFFDCSPLHDDIQDKFVVHELFHDMAIHISRNVFFACEDLLGKIPQNVRHLSLVPWERQAVLALERVTKEVGELDTFLVVNRYELDHCSMSSPLLRITGLDKFFLKFKSLKTLNLSYTIIGQLPASIGNLINLQYLAVNGTDIRNLPSELCLLKNLLTLEVRNCRLFVSLPEGIKNFAKLRHLDVRKQPGYVRMPFGVGQLIHLRALPVLNVGEDLSDCSIWELRDLDNLHGDLAITGLENIKVGNDAKEARLINKKYLKTLTLEWGDSSIYKEEDSEEIAAEILESLQPPSDLENLTVRSYSGCLFPLWIDKFPFDSLLSVTLDNCYNCTVLPALGDLPSLKYLCIRKMYALQKFGYASSLPEKRSGGKFPALELLKLWEMYELDGWIGVEDGDFPRLHNVSICGCPNLMSLPRVPSLVDLSFRCCNQLPDIPELQKLESLKIEGFQGIMTLDLPQGLPALKKLEISRCNELVSVVGLSTLSSVEKFKIVKCPKLDVANISQQHCFKKIITTR